MSDCNVKSDPMPGDELRECERLRMSLAAARQALGDAYFDIGDWLTLANYQRVILDHGHGACPTQYGIDASKRIREKISAVCNEIQEILDGKS